MISESFSKKSWKLFLFKSVLAFQPKDIFFVLVCFCFFLSFFFQQLVTWTRLMLEITYFFFKKGVRTKVHKTYTFFCISDKSS